MEYITSRWTDKEIYGDVLRCNGERVVLYDAAQLLQPFIAGQAFSLSTLYNWLEVYEHGGLLLAFNRHQRLVSIPNFLCFILPAFVGLSNLLPIERTHLQRWITREWQRCKIHKLDRQWCVSANDTSPCAEAEQSLFEASIVPRTPLSTDIDAPPELLYNPLVLQAHFQDVEPVNTVTPYVRLQDYLRMTGAKEQQSRPLQKPIHAMQLYRLPGSLWPVVRADEAFAGSEHASHALHGVGEYLDVRQL